MILLLYSHYNLIYHQYKINKETARQGYLYNVFVEMNPGRLGYRTEEETLQVSRHVTKYQKALMMTHSANLVTPLVPDKLFSIGHKY